MPITFRMWSCFKCSFVDVPVVDDFKCPFFPIGTNIDQQWHPKQYTMAGEGVPENEQRYEQLKLNASENPSLRIDGLSGKYKRL